MPLRIVDDYFDPALWCVASCCFGWVVSTISSAVFAILGMFIYMYIFMMAPIIFPIATMIALLLTALSLDYRDHRREQAALINAAVIRQANGPMIVPVVREPPRLALHPAAIASLPTFSYEKRGTSESVQCPICITAFEEREEVKQLPRCMHLYHPGCIDQWLRRSCSCPVCRDSARKDAPAGELVIIVE